MDTEAREAREERGAVEDTTGKIGTGHIVLQISDRMDNRGLTALQATVVKRGRLASYGSTLFLFKLLKKKIF